MLAEGLVLLPHGKKVTGPNPGLCSLYVWSLQELVLKGSVCELCDGCSLRSGMGKMQMTSFPTGMMKYLTPTK